MESPPLDLGRVSMRRSSAQRRSGCEGADRVVQVQAPTAAVTYMGGTPRAGERCPPIHRQEPAWAGVYAAMDVVQP